MEGVEGLGGEQLNDLEMTNVKKKNTWHVEWKLN